MKFKYRHAICVIPAIILLTISIALSIIVFVCDKSEASMRRWVYEGDLTKPKN